MSNWLQNLVESVSEGDSSIGFWIALLALNVATFLMYGWDKLCAIRGWRRVPEKTLLGTALLGAVIGAWCGCFLFRHKISKPSFMRGLIAVTVLDVAAAGALLYWLGQKS